VSNLAEVGEVAVSIVILFEVEYPDLKFAREKELADVVKKIISGSG